MSDYCPQESLVRPNAIPAQWNAFVGEIVYTVWVTFRPLALVQGLFLGTLLLGPMFWGGSTLLPAALRVSPLNALMSFGLLLAALTGPTRMLEEHRFSGTLEQLHLSPTPLSLLCLYRALIGSLTYAPLIAAAALILKFAARESLSFSPLMAAGYILAFTGTLGFGYLIAAAVLLSREAASLANLAPIVFVPITLVDATQLPWPFIRGLSEYLPVSLTAAFGNDVSAHTGGNVALLIRLAALGLAYLALGLLAFSRAQRKALNDGLLARY